MEVQLVSVLIRVGARAYVDDGAHVNGTHAWYCSQDVAEAIVQKFHDSSTPTVRADVNCALHLNN